MASASSLPQKSIARVLSQLGWRQTIKGALIFGLVTGVMVSIQGLAYAKGYRTLPERQQFSQAMLSAPALGMLYGEAANLNNTVEGYMVYRTMAFLGLAGAIWALIATTKLLRGNEAEGRWEVLLSGTASSRRVTLAMWLGFARAWLVSSLLSGLIIYVFTRGSDFNLSLGTGSLLVLAIYMPALLFAAIGALVSQLAGSQRRSLIYGLPLLIGLYILRALGNTLPNWAWLKYITPFGWADHLSPVINPNAWWLAGFGLTSLVGLNLALYLVGQRDLNASILPEKDFKKSRYFWLNGDWQFNLRRNLSMFTIWGLGVMGLGALTTAIASLATKATATSSQLNNALAEISGGATNLKVAFVAFGALLITFALLLFIINSWGDICREELRSRIDFALVGPLSRQRWLLRRLLIIAITGAAISLLSRLVIWTLGVQQNLPLTLGTMLSGGVQSYGLIIFILGAGCLIYGLKPRLTLPVLYGILIWSFTLDILKSVVHLHRLIQQSSLFNYLSLVPAVKPDWAAFGWLSGLGLVMLVLGHLAFNRRDLLAD